MKCVCQSVIMRVVEKMNIFIIIAEYLIYFLYI